jgi:hypothetical protein
MIKINPLYLLLLIELLLIFAGLIAFLVFREKKHIIADGEKRRELDTAHAAQVELQKQITTLTAGAARPAAATGETAAGKTPMPKADTSDNDALKREVAILEEKLKEKNKLLIELQAKFDSVEKEYLLLYQQQQAQEQHKN